MYLKEMIAILSVKGIGMQTLKKLIDLYGDMASLCDAIEKESVFNDTGLKKMNSIKEVLDTFDYEAYKKCLQKEGVTCLTYLENDYPKMLKNIDTFPLILHCKGTIKKLNELPAGIAVVGSRKISTYGQRIAYEMGRFLSKYELPVVSGLAYGVDYEVHKGLIKGGGFPVAVLANGLDRIYPSSHANIAKSIEKTGVLLTEEFLYSDISPYKFPIRNRIISGLSEVIVVVEAEEKSGSLITAQHGLDQGKMVFAVPGSIYSATSRGTNKLIAEGATPLLDFEQLIEVYESLKEKECCKENTPVINDLSQIEQQIISALGQNNSLSIEELTLLTKERYTEILMTAMEMEIKEIIRCVKGNKYQLL